MTEEKMTKEKILLVVKDGLKIGGDTSHDKDLNGKIDDTIAFLQTKGITEEVALAKYHYIIKRGAMDLFNYDNYQQLFNDMLIDALLEEGKENAKIN